MRPFSLPKSERLTHESSINKLFQEGATISSNPVRLVYSLEKSPESPGIKIMVTVSRKKFKKAVVRNRIKRMMREAYRQHKPSEANLATYSLHIAFIYIGDMYDITYEEIEKAIIGGLKKLVMSFSGLK